MREEEFLNGSELLMWKQREIQRCLLSKSFLEQVHVKTILIFCYALVFFFCIAGNFLLLLVIAIQRSMRTSTNFFLANLAVADLLVGVFCVLQNCSHILLFVKRWPFGSTMCHLYIFVLYLAPCVSAGILVLLSFEKYVAVLHPMAAKEVLTKPLLAAFHFLFIYVAVLHPMAAKEVLTKPLLAALTVLVWVFSIISNTPHYLTAKLYTRIHYSSEGNKTYMACGRDIMSDRISSKHFLLANFVIWYCIPLLCLVFLYSRIGVALYRSSEGVAKYAVARKRNGSTRTLDELADFGCTPKRDSNSNNITGAGATLGAALLTVPQRMVLEQPVTGSISEEKDIEEISEIRKKIIRLLTLIVSAFAVLTLPNHSRQLWIHWGADTSSCPQHPALLMLLQPLCFLLLFSNSGINPILYAFFSKRFRQAVESSVRCERDSRHRRRCQYQMSHLTRQSTSRRNTERTSCTLKI